MFNPLFASVAFSILANTKRFYLSMGDLANKVLNARFHDDSFM